MVISIDDIILKAQCELSIPSKVSILAKTPNKPRKSSRNGVIISILKAIDWEVAWGIILGSVLGGFMLGFIIYGLTHVEFEPRTTETVEPTEEPSKEVFLRYGIETFRVKENKQLYEKFTEFNEKYFERKLSIKGIGFSDSFSTDRYLAFTYHYAMQEENYNYIIIHSSASKYYNIDDILLHEMCHVYTNMFDKRAYNNDYRDMDCHDIPMFKEQIKRLKSIGLSVID